MRFSSGSPELFQVPGKGDGEKIVAVAFSPNRGSIFCVLTETELQFWSGATHWIFLTSLKVPRCGSSGGGGGGTANGATSDTASNMVWHPLGRMVVVTTMERRVHFCEADIILTDNSPVNIDPHKNEAISIVDAASRVCFSFFVTLDCGLVTSVCSSSDAVLATTSAGFVVVLSWASGKVLHMMNATSFFQQGIERPMADVVGGSLTFFTYNAKLARCAMVLADGTLCVLRPTTSEFASPALAFSGACVAGAGAEIVALNARHSLAAVACADGDVRMFALNDVSLVPFGGNRSSSWCEDMSSLGRVSALLWTSEEDAVCAAYKLRGVVVFHYSGVCLFCSFPRYMYDRDRLPVSSALPLMGCDCVSWDGEGFRLVAAQASSSSFLAFPMAKVATSVVDSFEGNGGTIVMHDRSSVSYLHMSSEVMAENWETIAMPPEYVRENNPIKYCAVSSDGSQLVCAGQNGCTVYSRRLRKWRLFGVRSQEKNFSCVADPCWISNLVAVLPVRNKAKQCFELVLFPRYHLDTSSILSTIPLKKRPLHVQCSQRNVGDPSRFCLLIFDTANSLQAMEVDIEVDDLSAPKHIALSIKHAVVHTTLPKSFCLPVQIAAIPMPREASVKQQQQQQQQSHALQPQQQQQLQQQQQQHRAWPSIAVLRRDHKLSVLNLNTNTFEDIEGDTSNFWISSCSVSAHMVVVLLITYTLTGVRLHCVPQRSGGSMMGASASGRSTPSNSSASGGSALGGGGGQSPVVGSSAVAASFVSQRTTSRIVEYDVETIPIGVLASDGFVVSAMEGTYSKIQIRGLMPTRQVSVKPELFMHAVLLPLFLAQAVPFGPAAEVSEAAQAETTMHQFAQRMRETGCFVDTMDYLLHSIIDVERRRETAIGLAYDQRRVLHAVLNFLRKYDEYYEVIVRCVRKGDDTKWRLIFDVIGSPHAFFKDCLNNNRIREAMHIVRAILMQRSDDLMEPLEAASVSSRQLFAIVVQRRDFHTAYELLRFITLLAFEIDLPPLRLPSTTPISAIERALRSMWPLSSSSALTAAAAISMHTSGGSGGSGGGSGGGLGNGSFAPTAVGSAGGSSATSERSAGGGSGGGGGVLSATGGVGVSGSGLPNTAGGGGTGGGNSSGGAGGATAAVGGTSATAGGGGIAPTRSFTRKVATLPSEAAVAAGGGANGPAGSGTGPDSGSVGGNEGATGSNSNSSLSRLRSVSPAAAGSGSATAGGVLPPPAATPHTGSLRSRQDHGATEHSKAFHKVLAKYSQMHVRLEAEAVAMLQSGNVSQLCELFEIFDLDLAHFIAVTWKRFATGRGAGFTVTGGGGGGGGGSGASSAATTPARGTGAFDDGAALSGTASLASSQTGVSGGSAPLRKLASSSLLSMFVDPTNTFPVTTMPSNLASSSSSSPVAPTPSAMGGGNRPTVVSLEQLFNTIHEEFALPRGTTARPAPSAKGNAADVAAAAAGSVKEDCALLRCNELGIVTATQEHLLVAAETHNVLASLLQLFMFHGCHEYVLVLGTLLLRVATVKRVLAETPSLIAPFLHMLSNDPRNGGYRRLATAIGGATALSPTSRVYVTI